MNPTEPSHPRNLVVGSLAMLAIVGALAASWLFGSGVPDRVLQAALEERTAERDQLQAELDRLRAGDNLSAPTPEDAVVELTVFRQIVRIRSAGARVYLAPVWVTRDGDRPTGAEGDTVLRLEPGEEAVLTTTGDGHAAIAVRSRDGVVLWRPGRAAMPDRTGQAAALLHRPTPAPPVRWPAELPLQLLTGVADDADSARRLEVTLSATSPHLVRESPGLPLLRVPVGE